MWLGMAPPGVMVRGPVDDLLSDLHRQLLQAEPRLRASEALAYGPSCSPCDRLVRSPDVAPLRGSITEEEATETPHPTRSLTRFTLAA